MGALETALIVISLLLCLVVGIGLWIWRKKKNGDQVDMKIPSIIEAARASVRPKKSKEKTERKPEAKILTSSDPFLPTHMVLEKGLSLRESAKEMAGRKLKLEEEFKMIGEHARANFQKETSVSRLERNLIHNRYLDIGKVFLS